MIAEMLAVVFLAALITHLAWRRPWRRRHDELQAMEEWLAGFSLDSYLPMLRLSSSADSAFLAVKKGPVEAARYRRLQRKLLREYLRVLARDFHRLHALATESAIRAHADQDDSSLALVEEKMEFGFSIWSIELRLLLDEFTPCVVDLRPLLDNVDHLTARAREVSRRRLEFRVS